MLPPGCSAFIATTGILEEINSLYRPVCKVMFFRGLAMFCRWHTENIRFTCKFDI